MMNELFLGKYLNDENHDNERLLETLEYVLSELMHRIFIKTSVKRSRT